MTKGTSGKGPIDARLTELGIVLPQPAAPAGAYVPFVRVGDLLFVSGQLPLLNGEMHFAGRLGAELAVEHGYAAARLCALNLLAQVRAACDGDLERVSRVVKLTGFVRADAAFTDHPKVLNGASDLMMEVFGEVGRHTRAAVGAASLPLNASVEVDGVFELEYPPVSR
ncbi:MAG: RidA family protein [Rhodospirillales bacterium]|nr:MAG: RidA family protein [Rhodospirillales bacterium]